MENKNKKLNFADLTINSTALLCPNPQDWFSRSYLDETTAANFRTIPGVKYKTNLANINFSSVLKAESCDWSASANVLSAQTITVTPLQAQLQLCKKDIETSFVSMEMAKGSSNWSDPSAFMGHYYETIRSEVFEEIEYIRWQGNTSATAYTGTYLALTDGYTKKITGTTGTIVSAATTVTTANVIGLMGNLLAALPVTVQSKPTQLRFYIASNVATQYRLATAAYNTNTNITQNLPFTFSNIQIVECPGMKSNQILVTRGGSMGNLIYAFDGDADAGELQTIDLQQTTGEKVLRTQAVFKIGFDITNPTEIAMYY